jgi:hypothetical protein
MRIYYDMAGVDRGTERINRGMRRGLSQCALGEEIDRRIGSTAGVATFRSTWFKSLVAFTAKDQA